MLEWALPFACAVLSIAIWTGVLVGRLWREIL